VEFRADWLTGSRLERCAKIICATPSSQLPAIEHDEHLQRLWRTCGGPWDEVSQLLVFLSCIGLLSKRNGAYNRSRLGDRVAKDLLQDNFTAFGLALIRSGCFHDQARLLVELGQLQPDGRLLCEHRRVKTVAAQFLGVLTWWADVVLVPEVVIPKQLVDEMNAVWAWVPPAVTPSWTVERQKIGLRAEMYTVQTEKHTAVDPTSIAWVARDSDSLGYDVEDRTQHPSRCIEVKGSREASPIFFLSENEWRRATELGSRYEVQFWGEIDLGREPSIEYPILRSAGYPIVIPNIVVAVREGLWRATSVRWKIEPKELVNH